MSSTTQLSIVCLSLLGMLTGGCSVFGPRPQTSYEANNQALALAQVVVFQDSTGALSYHAPTGKDVRVEVAPRVTGKACQHGIQVPIITKRSTLALSAGWGRGAYEEALSEARAGLPANAVLFDVRVDLNHLSILTAYRRLCLLVDAAVALPTPVAALAPAPALPAPAPEPIEPAAEQEESPAPPPEAAPAATPPAALEHR